MPTPPKDAKQALYAVAGAADLAVSTIRHLPENAERLRTQLPKEAVKTYDSLVRRGESLVTGIRRARSTREASEAARLAAARVKATATRAQNSARSTRSSAKAARTTAEKAVTSDVEAVKKAADKVGKS